VTRMGRLARGVVHPTSAPAKVGVPSPTMKNDFWAAGAPHGYFILANLFRWALSYRRQPSVLETGRLCGGLSCAQADWGVL
jgi:hypothetical protein